MGNYFATWSDDGSGDWSITLPTDCSEHDLDALSPLVQTIKAFLAPTIEGVCYTPTELGGAEAS